MSEFLAEALFLLPIGFIGLFRWSAWLYKRMVGALYAPEPPHDSPSTVSVVTPVYNEDPETFSMAIDSWLQNNPLEIIAVIDAEDVACTRLFEEKREQLGDSRLKLIPTSIPGKRPALATGVRATRGDIVALVDSDTIWEADALPKLKAPFVHDEVGGVTCRQRVYQVDTLSQRLTDLMFDLRYADEMPYLGRMDQGFSCLSGRTAVYRRTALLPILDGMLNETFWGNPSYPGKISGLPTCFRPKDIRPVTRTTRLSTQPRP